MSCGSRNIRKKADSEEEGYLAKNRQFVICSDCRLLGNQ